MPDIGDESVVMIMQITEHLLLAPAADMMRYCRDAAATVGGSTVEAVKASAAKAKDAMDGHGRTGQVSMKTLVREAEGAELVSIPIESRDLQTVQSQLKAYGVTFAVMVNPSTSAISAHFRAASADQVATALRGVVKLAAIEQGREGEQQTPEQDDGKVRYGQLVMDEAAFIESLQQAREAEQGHAPDHAITAEEWAAHIASELENGNSAFEFEGQRFDLAALAESGAVSLAEPQAKEEQRENAPDASEPEWAEIDGEAYAERDGMVICAREDGTVSIYETDEQGEEREVLSDRSPIAALPLAKSYALAEASRLAAQRERPESAKVRDEGKAVQEVFREASQKAEERNDAAAEKPLEKAAERPAPAR